MWNAVRCCGGLPFFTVRNRKTRDGCYDKYIYTREQIRYRGCHAAAAARGSPMPTIVPRHQVPRRARQVLCLARQNMREDDVLLRARACLKSTSFPKGDADIPKGGWTSQSPQSLPHGPDNVISPITPVARAATSSGPGNEGFVHFPCGEICFHFQEPAAACCERE